MAHEDDTFVRAMHLSSSFSYAASFFGACFSRATGRPGKGKVVEQPGVPEQEISDLPLKALYVESAVKYDCQPLNITQGVMNMNTARCAIVTGGASGIGLSIAEGLAAEGHHVVIGDLNEENGRAVTGSCWTVDCGWTAQ